MRKLQPQLRESFFTSSNVYISLSYGLICTHLLLIEPEQGSAQAITDSFRIEVVQILIPIALEATLLLLRKP